MNGIFISGPPKRQKFGQQSLQCEPQSTLAREREGEDDDQQRAGDKNSSGHRGGLLSCVCAVGVAQQKSGPEIGIDANYGDETGVLRAKPGRSWIMTQ
jgi:hypothetical protein